MAIVVKGNDNGSDLSNSGSATITISLTAPTDSDYLIAIINSGYNSDWNDPTPTGVTWNGDSMTEQLEAIYTRTSRYQATNIFTLANPDIGTYNLVITKPSSASDIFTYVTIIGITGQAASPIGANAKIEGNDDTVAYADVTTTQADSLLVGGSMLYRRGTSNPPGVYTERANTTETYASADTDNYMPNVAHGYRLVSGAAGNYEIGWTSDNDSSHAFAALEIKESSGVTYNHTKKTVTATKGSHTTARVESHTTKVVTATTKDHTPAVTHSHTTKAVTASLKTHTTARVQSHTTGTASASTGTHQPTITISHTKITASATTGTHTLLRTQVHTTTAVTASKGTHTMLRVQPHTKITASSTLGTHTTVRTHIHSTTAVTAVTKSHQPTIIFSHTKITASTSAGTHSIAWTFHHVKTAVTATTGTHTIVITPFGTSDPEGSDLPIAIGIFI